MILRIWHGYTTPENANAYEETLRKEVFEEIKSKNIQGFKGMQLLRRMGAGEVEFMTIMTFENIEAIKQFAGEQYEQAYIPDEARQVLSRFDDKAQHFELVLQLG